MNATAHRDGAEIIYRPDRGSRCSGCRHRFFHGELVLPQGQHLMHLICFARRESLRG